MTVFIAFLFCMNILAFFAYAIDKHFACYDQWRIPEAALIAVAVAGGAYGAAMAMLLFRHKTLHRLFTITVPLCLIAWLAVVTLLYIGD